MVEYLIEVEADSPKEAALQAADHMKNMTYKPYLTVIAPGGEKTDINLELE